jgi:hypothetical protein
MSHCPQFEKPWSNSKVCVARQGGRDEDFTKTLLRPTDLAAFLARGSGLEEK